MWNPSLREQSVVRAFGWAANAAAVIGVVLGDAWSAKICALSSLMFFASHRINARLRQNIEYSIEYSSVSAR